MMLRRYLLSYQSEPTLPFPPSKSQTSHHAQTAAPLDGRQHQPEYQLYRCP